MGAPTLTRGERMTDDERRQIEKLHAEVLREYGEQLGSEEVSARFAAIVAEFEDAQVRTFVPLLTQRLVRQELDAASSAD